MTKPSILPTNKNMPAPDNTNHSAEHYAKRWEKFRRWNRQGLFSFFAMPLIMLLSFALGIYGLAFIGAVALLLAMFSFFYCLTCQRFFKCPRCNKFFYITTFRSTAGRQCVHCKLKLYEIPES